MSILREDWRHNLTCWITVRWTKGFLWIRSLQGCRSSDGIHTTAQIRTSQPLTEPNGWFYDSDCENDRPVSVWLTALIPSSKTPVVTVTQRWLSDMEMVKQLFPLMFILPDTRMHPNYTSATRLALPLSRRRSPPLFPSVILPAAAYFLRSRRWAGRRGDSSSSALPSKERNRVTVCSCSTDCSCTHLLQVSGSESLPLKFKCLFLQNIALSIKYLHKTVYISSQIILFILYLSFTFLKNLTFCPIQCTFLSDFYHESQKNSKWNKYPKIFRIYWAFLFFCFYPLTVDALRVDFSCVCKWKPLTHMRVFRLTMLSKHKKNQIHFLYFISAWFYLSN